MCCLACISGLIVSVVGEGVAASAHRELVGVGDGGMHASAHSELVCVGDGGMHGSAHRLLAADLVVV